MFLIAFWKQCRKTRAKKLLCFIRIEKWEEGLGLEQIVIVIVVIAVVVTIILLLLLLILLMYQRTKQNKLDGVTVSQITQK